MPENENVQSVPHQSLDEIVTFEDILDVVGEYGRYQKRLVYFYLVPCMTLMAAFGLSIYLMVSAPDAWCSVPELDGLAVEVQQRLSRPPLDGFEGKYDTCHYYDINYGEVVSKYKASNYSKAFKMDYGKNVSLKACKSWNYDKTNFDANAATAHNLVCERATIGAHVLIANQVGWFIGNFLVPYLTDQYGRRIVFLSCLSVNIVTPLVSPVFTTNIYAFAASRFVVAIARPPLMSIPLIIMSEIVGPKFRTRMTVLLGIFRTVGSICLPWLMYFARDWVTMSIISSLAILPLCIGWKFLPESPRWLISQGRYEEAHYLVAEIAKINGKPYPPHLKKQLEKIGMNGNQEKEGQSRLKAIELVKSPGLFKKFLLISLCWVTAEALYSVIILSITNLSGNEIVNRSLMEAIELPSMFGLWFMMDSRLGRRWTTISTMFISGVLMCLPAMFKGVPYVDVVSSLGGNLLNAMTYHSMNQWATELFPTPIRTQAIGWAASFDDLVGMALPYLTVMSRHMPWFPLFVVGTFNLAVCVAIAFLPETLNEKLLQTMEDGNSFGKEQKFFSLAKTSKRTKGEEAEMKHFEK